MTEIKVEIYENEAEITDFVSGGADMTVFFSKHIEGHIEVSGMLIPILGKKCFIDLRREKDREIAMNLLICDRVIALPTIIKDGNTLTPAPISDDFLRELSKRERLLEGKVRELDATVKKLMKSVYGTTLFN